MKKLFFLISNYYYFSLDTRKGKVKPLSIIEKDDTGSYLNFFANLGAKDIDIDFDTASEFVSHMYGQTKTADVNEVRYLKLMEMSGKIKKVIQIQKKYKQRNI